MTTHYMDEAEFCDRIAIMDQGEIVALDTPEALKAQVGADRVRIQTDDDDAAIAALRERFGIEAAIAEGAVTFYVAVRRGVRAAAVRRARRRRSRRSACRARRSTTSSCATPARRSATPRRPARRTRNRVMMQSDARGPAMSAAIGRDVVAASGSPERTLARRRLRAIKIVWRRELIRFASDRMRIVTSLIQPLLFLFVLGSGLQSLSAALAPTASTSRRSSSPASSASR